MRLQNAVEIGASRQCSVEIKWSGVFEGSGQESLEIAPVHFTAVLTALHLKDDPRLRNVGVVAHARLAW